MKTATPRMARAINDRLALDLLLEHGPLSAPRLRDLTGLSRPTVSDLIERLRADGLIEATGESGERRRGPNARLYGIVTGRAHVAGVDLRRDGVQVSVADIAGGAAGSAGRPLGAEPDPVALVADAVQEAADGTVLHTVVVGAPGLVHPRTGVTAGGLLPGGRPDLLQALRDRLGVPVVLENEVNLAAIAEHRDGAAAGRDEFALLWLDDGVGAALVLDGRLRRGASGGAGEVAYLRAGDREICDIVEELPGLGDEAAADRIAEVAVALVAVLDPGLVVLGGALGRAGGERLAARVAERLAVLSPAPTEVRPSVIAGGAVLRGAVLTALDRARDDLFG
ncbi:ROK family transcriptional regulator [Spirillospora albida]|uniref:ROK family transcriptional regulator n=1 Tax=Spirillospora albida TaxID=58123 RepID=UPI001B80BED1|nr:ROK family transcriptional regulator [Spirillospora albida]